MIKAYQRKFLDLCVSEQILQFGEFTLKSGRHSPYFFNAGRFCSGASLGLLGESYAQAILEAEVPFDLLFGPAYKGITLAAATAIALSGQHQRDVPICYDRKEVKDHGEGGQLIGAPLAGRVLIIDDVVSSGLSIRAAANLIDASGGQLAGVVLALDRQERGRDGGSANDQKPGESTPQAPQSAGDELSRRLNVPVFSIINLQTLIDYLSDHPDLGAHRKAVVHYRERYGAAPPGNRKV